MVVNHRAKHKNPALLRANLLKMESHWDTDLEVAGYSTCANSPHYPSGRC